MKRILCFLINCCILTIVFKVNGQTPSPQLNFTCPYGMFKCENGLECVPTNQVCNRRKDCSDRSDEKGCMLPYERCWSWQPVCLANGTCAPSYFQCNNGKCIRFDLACDRKDNCGDRSDEIRAKPGLKCIFGNSSDTCVLPQRYVNDSTVDCSDEADSCTNSRNENTCFKCFDGRAIISNRQVCDGVFDCFDLSDECLCEKTIEANTTADICSQVCVGGRQGCRRGTFKCDERQNASIRITDVCNGKLECPDGRDERYCRKLASSEVITCPGDRVNRSKLTAFKCDGIPECYDLSDECGGVCETEQAFCEFRKTFLQSTMLEYNCSNGIRIATNEICNGFWSRCEPRVEFEESQCPGRFKCKSGRFVSIDRSLVCNGYRNCDDGSDELNCKDRFYCTTGQRPTSVPTWFRFDDFSDCDDGSDECPPALKNSIISSRNEMISNGFLRAWLWIMAIIALSGNAYVICKTCLKYEKLKTCSAIAKGNYFLIFNLALSDFLMGVYLAVVAGYSVSFSGKYCFEDEGWRTGTTCAYLGALSVTSSEASLFILSVLTAMRLYTILFPWRSRNISLVQVLIAVIIAWAVAVTLAVLPLGAYFSEIVTEGAWLPSKFFNSTVVRLNQAKIFTDQVGMYTRNSTPLVMYANGSVTWSSVRAYLNMYSPDNTIQGLYGYYSRSSVCLSKFFVRSNASGWQFAIVIVSVNFLLFLFIAGSYLVIYKHSNTTKPTKSTEKDRAAKMQSKIIKLVATDFTCWVPICIMSFMHFSRIVTITDTGYIVTAVVLLPINSVLNPLLYSNVFEKLWRRIKPLGKTMVSGIMCQHCRGKQQSEFIELKTPGTSLVALPGSSKQSTLEV